jgi:NAD(P)-dependent dehydrogenase (short-subunit alcohol dehydrogenase family)
VHSAKILARQWKVRVNVVAPGMNEAGMAESSVRSGKYNPFLEKRIIPRFGSPQDVSRTILFFWNPMTI